MYHQEFIQGSQPADIIVNSFGTPNGAVQWAVGPSPKMLGWAVIPLDVGTTVHEGRCVTLRTKYLRRARDKFRFRWFHFQEPLLRYYMGIFEELAYNDTQSRITACFNGTEFGMLYTTSTTNLFAPLATLSNQTVYECELEMINNGAKLTLFNSDGSEIATVSKTTDIPGSSKVFYVGAQVWAGGTITAGTELNLDSISVDMRS